MNEEQLRKAQQASRSAYLRREAVRRERAAAAVLQQRLSEVEQGMIPSTLTEAELLLKRSREIATAESLLATAQQREALTSDKTTMLDYNHRYFDNIGDVNYNNESITIRKRKRSEVNIITENNNTETAINAEFLETSSHVSENDATDMTMIANTEKKCEEHKKQEQKQEITSYKASNENNPVPQKANIDNNSSNNNDDDDDNDDKETKIFHDNNAFVPLDKSVIEERIARGEYESQKTVAELESERVTLIQSTRERLRAQRTSLPIYTVRSELLRVIRDNQVIVIVGETGSGKTTQLLQYLYEEGMHLAHTVGSSSSKNNNSSSSSSCCSDIDNNVKMSEKMVERSRRLHKEYEKEEKEEKEEEEEELRLICTQPRRIAAISVAERVAQEVGCRCGSVVGYKVRFDEKCSPQTRIIFMTDGIMLKEFTNDPNLDSVAAIMVDEAHERSINTDILLGLLRDLLRRNHKIKIIVASATINAIKFSTFFNNAPVFTVHGRTFPVEVFYADVAAADYITEAAQTVLGLHLTKPLPGDILVFLPGQDAIEACAESLKQYLAESEHNIRPLLILPIYASLASKEQARIYDVTPPGVRKVVIATNIAETSITIDGVVYVVDCGLCKQDYYNARTMVEELRVVPISQASATQRAGRAGRTQRGECYRLYTPYTMKNELPNETIPEIKRCSMSAVVLQLKALGIDNLLQFDFIDMPSTVSLERALDHLYLLGGMRSNGKLTVTGRRMAEFPLEPSLSRCLIKGCALGCGRHIAMAAAMLTLESIFILSRDAQAKRQMESAKETLFSSGNGDVVGYVRILEEWLRTGSVARSSEFCKTYCIHPRALLRARDVFDQILKIYDRVGLDVNATTTDTIAPNDNTTTTTTTRENNHFSSNGLVINCELITRALLAGFFFNVARLELDKRTYRIIHPLDSTLPNASDDPSRNSTLLMNTITNNNYNNSSNFDGDNGERDGGGAPVAEIHPSSYLFKIGMKQPTAKSYVNAKPLSTLSTSFTHGLTPALMSSSSMLHSKIDLASSQLERPFLVVFVQLRHTTKRYMTHITAINSADWVMDCAPVNYFEREELENKLRKRTF